MKPISFTPALILAFTSFSISFGQKSESTLLKSNIGTANIIELPYKELLDREFTKILTGQTTNFGTSATLGTKDDIASLSGHIPFKGKSNSNLGINVKGGATEGTIPLINGEKINSNISIGVQFNLGIYRNHYSIILDATQKLNFVNTLDSLLLAAIKNRDEIKLSKQKKALELEQKKEKIKTLENYKKTITIKNDVRKFIIIDSIDVEMVVLKNDTSYLQMQLNKLESKDEIKRQIQNAEESKVNKYKKELQNLNLIGYKLDWLAFFINLNNRTFNLLDKTLNYDNQINKKTFNVFEFGISHNTYQLRDESFKTYYSAIGVSYLLEDNFEDLTGITLSQKEEISSTPTNRSITVTKTVYYGDYKNYLSNLKIYYNLYWFMTYNQSLAVHFNPSCRYDLKDKIKLDCIVGFLVPFHNQEKDKSVINVELYYNMKDLFKKSENKEDEFVDRASLGINLNFPIFFKSNL